MALCAGVFLPRRLALVVPLGILLLSDLVIDLHYGANFFAASLLARYALLALIGLGGMALRRAPRGGSLPPCWARPSPARCFSTPPATR